MDSFNYILKTNSTPKNMRFRKFNGFSLIEILVVLGILSILLGLGGVAFYKITKREALITTGNLIVDHLRVARMESIARNQRVAMQFYKLKLSAESESSWKGFQLFLIDENEVPTPLSKLMVFSKGVTILEDGMQSSLLNLNLNLNLPHPKQVQTIETSGFLFFPTGGTSFSKSNEDESDSWTLTLVQKGETNQKTNPKFYTITLDPHTGRVGVWK